MYEVEPKSEKLQVEMKILNGQLLVKILIYITHEK